MQRSYLDYAMTVIVGRALPDVRDGLKPVHRRVLYAMFDGGYRPERGFSKCSRVVGDVMGNYHPHGDTAIYDTLVRLGQWWSMRYLLVQGQGNFGSRGDDRQAAMRYCVTGDTRVRTADLGTVRIADIVPEAEPNSDTDIDLKLFGRSGELVHASKFFHSGEHPTLRLRTKNGYEVTGTHNHPVLTLSPVDGVPTLTWKLLGEVEAGDVVVAARTEAAEMGLPDAAEVDAAVLAGAFVSEGFVSSERAGFNNVDAEYFTTVLDAYDAVVGGPRYVSERQIASGSTLHELDVQDLTALRASVLAPMTGDRSADKRVPEFVWAATASVKVEFLRSLFTGDGSVSSLPRDSVQISYSTRSRQLAGDVQQLLLEQGIVSSLCFYDNGEIKVVIGNRHGAERFAERVGFLGTKHDKLGAVLGALPAEARGLGADHVPHLAEFLRRPESARRSPDHTWLKLHNVDRVDRWERRWPEIADRLTDEALDVVEPLVDGRFYYAEVAAVEDAGVRPVYSLRVDTDDHAFITNGLVSHNTECRMAPLAMDMVREIDEETVDFSPNYDNRGAEPDVLPSRFPNLLVNGSGGIAVGMATNIPPHNLREVASGVDWYLENPDADNEQLLDALLERVKGPDFPTSGLIVGTNGIEQAYRTGRGSVTMRAVVEVEEDSRGRTCLVISELPYQVNPDALTRKIAELADSGKVPGIADLRDDSSSRTGMRLVVVLKRDAVPTVVRNNLYKHTQLQDTFGCNMVALVDGVPRTLSLDGFVRHWVAHQVEVIRRRTEFRLRKKRERLHIVLGLLKAIDAIDEVIALIRRSQDVDEARTGLMQLLDIDEVQATAILDMQLRRLTALSRDELQNEHDTLIADIADLEDILASDERKRSIIREELGEIVDKFGDERRTRIVAAEGDMTAEDLIPEEPVVVTITRGGYAKRTKAELYRSQKRGGKGVRGAQLREDDVVSQFFVTTTHHWVLFFTNRGRVYRAKAHELPELARDAKGQHVANLLAFQPDEKIARVLTLRDYEQEQYLVLATKNGMIKKTRLTEYDSSRSGGVIAILFREEDDELIGAELVGAEDDLLLVSRKAQAIRFTATDEQLRPMGRATGGVVGMKFREGDELLSMSVVRDGTDWYVFTVTDGGFAKRTAVEEYRVQGRGGLGIKAMKINEDRGSLVGALVVDDNDDVLAIRASGGVTRSPVRDVPAKGRDTMGVKYVALGEGDAVVAIARNAEDESVVEPGHDSPDTDAEGDGS
ncbi:intein-containing DNA gyrase subunit A [Haloactinopolyspora alba]